MKKLKGKVIAIATGAFLLGGGTVYAAENYYAELLAGKQQDVQEQVEQIFLDEAGKVNNQIHTDMINLVNASEQEILAAASDYAKEKVQADAAVLQDELVKGVEAEKARIIEEIKAHIDTMTIE